MIPRILLATFLAVGPLFAEDKPGTENQGGSATPARETPANLLAGKMLAGFGVSATKKGIRIRHVYKNSPADKAGSGPAI